MNELQIKLTADIASFKAAMATVEQKLKNAETILEKASGEADKYRGALASLSAEYKRGAISQEQYDKQVNKLSSDLLKQQDIINNSTLEVNRLSREYNKLGSSSLIANQNKLTQSTNNLGNSVNGLTKNVANGNGVALEFNRIIQDAPFGIIGIGNNIQQLAGNFSQLKASAGGTGAALKASFAALASGPNIALLAISALTAGFTAYQMGVFSSKDKTKELVDEIDRLREASENYLKTLSAVNLSRVKGEQSAQEEIVSLNRLFKATTDTTLSLEQRQRAVDALQKTYPNVFGNIRDEIILNGGAQKSYEQLTDAILANARAKAAESTLVKNEETLIALQTEREELNQKIAKSEALIDLKKKDQVVTVGQLKSLGQQIADSETRLIEPSLKRRAEIGKEINKLTKDNLELTNKVRENFQSVGTLLDPVPTKVDAVTASVEKLNRTFEADNDFIDQFLQRNAQERLDTFASSYENVFMKVESGKGIILEANQAIDTNLNTLAEQTTDYTNTILSAFTDLGVGIVSSLDISNNSLRGFLTTLVSATPKIIGAM
jgi:chromosome segregation ATPase